MNRQFRTLTLIGLLPPKVWRYWQLWIIVHNSPEDGFLAGVPNKQGEGSLCSSVEATSTMEIHSVSSWSSSARLRTSEHTSTTWTRG